MIDPKYLLDFITSHSARIKTETSEPISTPPCVQSFPTLYALSSGETHQAGSEVFPGSKVYSPHGFLSHTP